MKILIIALALVLSALPSLARTELTATTTFQVSQTGSDGNDCIGSPCLTLQHVMNRVQTGYDFAGKAVTVSVAASGTCYAGFSLEGPNVGQAKNTDFVLSGDPTTPSNVCVNSTISLGGGARMIIDGISIGTTTGGGFVTQDGGTILYFRNVVFNAVAGDHWTAGPYSRMKAIGNYTIAGNAVNHMSALIGQAQVNGSVTVTISGTPHFTGYYALATELGLIDYSGVTHAGTPITSVVGSQYGISLNAAVYTGGTHFPGNAAGYVAGPAGAPY